MFDPSFSRNGVPCIDGDCSYHNPDGSLKNQDQCKATGGCGRGPGSSSATRGSQQESDDDLEDQTDTVKITYTTVLPNGTELIILNNGLAFINGYPVPPGGPDPYELAQWIDGYVPGGFAPSPYSVNGVINLKSDPLVATLQRIGGYCNSWHQFAGQPTCSDEFASAISDQLLAVDNYREVGTWFVGISYCYAVCLAITYADGALWMSMNFGCCGAGVTAGNTTVPASEQSFEHNYSACASYFVGACILGGQTVNGGMWMG